MPVSMMVALKVRRSTIAAQRRGSVKVLVQPPNDQQVRFTCAGVADRAQRLALADPFAGREGVDGCRVDVRVGVEVEVFEPFLPGEPGSLEPPL